MIDEIAFEEYLDGAKGLDKWTITIYMNYFQQFNIDEFILNGNIYLNKFIGQHNNPPCRAMVKHFFNFIKTSENIDPALLDKCNKAVIERRTGAIPHKEKPILTYSEVERLANNMKDDWSEMMVITCYNLGLRISELISLKLADIDWENDTVRVTGKRNKERTIKMSNEFSHKLAVFIDNKAENNKGYLYEEEDIEEINKYVFPKYTIRQFEDSLVDTAKKIGFNQIITSHCLRRSVATKLSSMGMPIEEVRDFLGHAEISTTTAYIIKPKQDAMNKAANMLNNLGKA